MPSQPRGGQGVGEGFLPLGGTALQEQHSREGRTRQSITRSQACLCELLEERAAQRTPPATSARSKSSAFVGAQRGWGSVGAEATPGSREAPPRGT